MSTTSETIPESWSSEDISGGSPTSSFSSFDAESPENSRRALIVNKMLDEDMPSTSLLEERVLPKINAKLPLQSDATGWLKYLLFFVLFCIAILLVGTEIGTRILLKNGVSSIVDSFASKVWSDPLVSTCTVFAILVVVGRSIVIDVSTFVMLLHGKRRRSLPENKHLIHAVVITQYKEPIEVLEATVSSLAESTLAHATIVILACEDRDPNARDVFGILEGRYGNYFRDFIMTSHVLMPGEIAGCSSNENYAARSMYKYALKTGLDPFRVMLTICDADSLFDKCYLEHVEAEFWSTPGGERALYDAPINTYRNLNECNFLVQACEISRCQDGLFNGLEFRPAQSNYSLTLGFANEIDFWDPSNTSEDFHCTLKAMAASGQGENVVVRVWSLILNDSVPSFKDRWIQAKRHMWGIEECCWTMSAFQSTRVIRWLKILSLTLRRMLLCSNVIPTWLVLLCPSVRELLTSISPESRLTIGLWIFGGIVGYWMRVAVRELLVRSYILGDRKHMQKAGWTNWLMLLTVFPIVENVSIFIFFTCATWVQLVRALKQKSIVYVVAPKAFNENEDMSPADEEGGRKTIKKSA